MRKTPSGMRIHIGIFGRRNVGKSSLLNALTRQSVAIVSPVAGTTTDPVEKPMELLPVGPVLFIDTAGLDDVGDLGTLRVGKTRRALERTDLALVVTTAGEWGDYEESLCGEFTQRGVPVLAVFNKCDVVPPKSAFLDQLRARTEAVVCVSARSSEGIDALRLAIVEAVPEERRQAPVIVGDLVPPGAPVVLVVPIDLEAPKGRLILPQVQTLRDILDHDQWAIVVKEHQLSAALRQLRSDPALVVTDSQAFAEVAAQLPERVPLTSFSILFARLKGHLETLVAGARELERLRPGDRVLVAEACTHHPIGEDIGRVKIPLWLQERVGGDLHFDTVQGRDFPDDLTPYRLVIHCGACMWNRQAVLSRLQQCLDAGVPVTNYGMAIAGCKGILPRALAPFGWEAEAGSPEITATTCAACDGGGRSRPLSPR